MFTKLLPCLYQVTSQTNHQTEVMVPSFVYTNMAAESCRCVKAGLKYLHHKQGWGLRVQALHPWWER